MNFTTANGTRGARQPRGRFLRWMNKWMMNRIRQILSAPNAVDENFEDRKEYETYITRATDRLQQIEQASK